MANFNDWFDQEPTEVVKSEDLQGEVVLSEGIQYSRGLIGPWRVGVIYRVWIANQFLLGNDGTPDLARVPSGYAAHAIYGSGGFFYYKADMLEQARLAQGMSTGSRTPRDPNQFWRWELNLSEVIGWTSDKPPQEVFGGDTRIHDTQIDRFDPANWKHAGFDLLMLPSWVQAFATYRGWIKDQIYDYASLQHVREPGYDQTKRFFEDGELLKAREEIWKALGENNASNWNNNPKSKDFVSAPKLKLALTPLFQREVPPIVARVVGVVVPHGEAFRNDKNNPDKVYWEWASVVTDFYGSVQVATEAVEAAAGVVAGKKVPANWLSDADKWPEFFASFLRQERVPTDPEAAKSWMFENPGKLHDTLGVTPSEAVPWL